MKINLSINLQQISKYWKLSPLGFLSQKGSSKIGFRRDDFVWDSFQSEFDQLNCIVYGFIWLWWLDYGVLLLNIASSLLFSLVYGLDH